MSCHQEDLNVDSEPEESQNAMSPTIFQKTTIIQVPFGSSVNLVVGDHNQLHNHRSQSVEKLCGKCSSANSSPNTTINRSVSTEYLDSPTQDEIMQGKGDDLLQKFENCFGPLSPIVIQRRSPKHENPQESEISGSLTGDEGTYMESETDNCNLKQQRDLVTDGVGSYSYQESDTSSCCGSDLTTESSETDEMRVEPPILPRRLKIRSPKQTIHLVPKLSPQQTTNIVMDEEDYMSMTGSAGSLNDPRRQSIPQQKDQRSTSGKIPRHKIEEAQATLGFRSDVNGELKRVRRILRPYKSKDGFYVLWQFSDYVLSLSVTFLQDIKTFAVIYDRADQSWLILKNGPRSTSLSTLLQLYMRNRIKLPLSNGQNKSVSLSPAPIQRSIAVNRNTSFSHHPTNCNAPPLPPRRASEPTLPLSSSPLLPPRPQGFLTLQIPVIQPIDDYERL